MASEDFSFPKISNPCPSFAISPSLWRVSSVVYPDDQEDDQKEANRLAKVYSCLEFGENSDYQVTFKRGNSSSDLEKMDMLWEDFNEELRRVCKSDEDKNNQPEKTSSSSSSSSSPSNTGLLSDSITPVGRAMQIHDYQGKRQSNMVAFVKLLKRIVFTKRTVLLDGNTSRIKKNYW